MTYSDRERVGRSFQRGAEQYDQHTPVQQRVVQCLLDQLSRLLADEPSTVLDIGCGTGRLLSQLLPRYPQAALTGLDLAPNMLQQAEHRLAGRAALVHGDAEQLPFPDQCFDLVVSSSTFQWLEQCDSCFGEVRRVLKDNGVFCFALFGEGTLLELQTSWREALVRSGRQLDNAQDGTKRFHNLSEIRDALVRQRFDAVEVATRLEVAWYPDLPQLLQAIKRIGAGTARPPAGGGLGWRRVLHEMAAIYTGRFGTGRGVPASYQVIYGAARRRSG